LSLFFFILLRQEQKILARKGRLLACDQERKSLIGVRFRYSGMLRSDTQISAEKATFTA